MMPFLCTAVGFVMLITTLERLIALRLQTRLSIPFAGEIDPRSVTSDAVFLINLGSTLDRRDADAGKVVGINQVVWDTFTHTLHVESDELLAQHTRYAIIVTDRLRDALGRPVAASSAFRQFRQVAGGEYRRALLRALRAAKRLGVRERDIVAASVYTTQSVTPVMERIRDQIKDGTPNPANFRLGPTGERAVFLRPDVATIAWSQHTRVSPPSLAPAVALDTAVLDVVPGAVGAIAYGTFVAEAPMPRIVCHWSQRSLAASLQFENSNLNPYSSSLRGTTRRLLRMSSVSVRMSTAPISSIQFRAGNPNGTPYASRSRRMKSAFGRGLGDATFTMPSTSSRSISQRTAAAKSS